MAARATASIVCSRATERTNICAIARMTSLLDEIPFVHYLHIVKLLDQKVSGSDYATLAYKYGFSILDVQGFATAHYRGERPSWEFLRTMGMRLPETSIQDFAEQCSAIGRTDIMQYMEDNFILQPSKSL